MATETAPSGGTDAAVTYEDQQCINQFSTINSKYKDIKAELEAKKILLQSIEEASDEILLLESDENMHIPYQIGETFFEFSPEDAQKRLERAKGEAAERIQELETAAKKAEAVMLELKARLYAKFGQRINLEEGDDD